MNKKYSGYLLLALAIGIVLFQYFKYRVAPNFNVNELKLVTAEGKAYPITFKENKLLVISFFTTWCGSCHQEFKEIQQAKFKNLIPDVDFFIKMHILKEGTKSSRIEGTQTNIDDAVQKEENIEAEKKDDWLEVHNYVEAMNQSIKSLDKLPLSNRLLKQAHKTLMRGARGNRKTPGEFRKSQNWIGGVSLRDAVFILTSLH